MNKYRIDIKNINDLDRVLKVENNKEKFQSYFGKDKEILEALYKELNKDEIIYRVEGIEDLYCYIKNQIKIHDLNSKIIQKFSCIDKLIIEREEYQKEISVKENVEDRRASCRERV